MPNAIRIDRSPTAPGQTLTPLELARAAGLVGRWLICRTPISQPCAHDQPRHTPPVADLAPHAHQPTSGGTCQHCPLPAGHRVHRLPAPDPDITATEARRLGDT